MRQRYNTSAIVLGRTPLAEASALIYLLTPEFGLVKARAQGVRKAGAKLSCAVQTLVESDVILVKGKEGWRLGGALLCSSWFGALTTENRARAGRVARFLLRMVHGETNDTQLFFILKSFLEVLTNANEVEADSAEHIVVLRLLNELGLDAGSPLGSYEDYSSSVLAEITRDKREYVMRINRGISASGL